MQSAVLIIATSKNFIQPKLVYPSYKPSGKVKRNGRQTVSNNCYSLINPNLYEKKSCVLFAKKPIDVAVSVFSLFLGF